MYSRVHISSDEVFSKILRKPSIVQKKMIPHMKAKVVFIGKKQKQIFFLKNTIQNGRLKKKLIFQLCQFSIFFYKNFMDGSFSY